MIIMAEKVNIEKELKALEKEYKLENVSIKEDEQVKKAKKVKKKQDAKKTLSFKKSKWFKTKAPRGQADVPLDDTIGTFIVSMPFDYWSTSRHPLWKLEPEQEAKLAKSFTAAFGPLIPWMIRRYFPIITFAALFLKTVEEKRKIEARLMLEEKISEFSPRHQKKLRKKLGMI